jgi:hypothetical protein
MKKENDDKRICSNPGCGRPAQDDSSLCGSCDLEWSLFHREARAQGDARPGVPAPSDGALPAS